MGYPVAFRGTFSFHNQDLLEAAKDEIRSCADDTFLSEADFVQLTALSFRFDVSSYGPASSYEETTLLLSFIETIAAEWNYELFYDSEQEGDSSGTRSLPDCYVNLAGECYDRAEYDRAVFFSNKALESEPASDRALYIRGAAAGGLKNYEEAFQYLTRIQTPGRFYSDAINLIVTYKIQLMQFRSGILILDQAIQKEPENGWLYFLRGKMRLLSTPGLSSEGLADWKKAIENDYSFLPQAHADLLGATGIEELQQFIRETEKKRSEEKERRVRELSKHVIASAAPPAKTKREWSPLHFISPLIALIGIIVALFQYNDRTKNKHGGLPATSYNQETGAHTFLNDHQLAEIYRTKQLPAVIFNDEKLQITERWLLDSFPSGISRMRKLKVLYISGCPFKSVPDSIGFLPELRMLYISKTAITSLPQSFSQLDKLEELDLSRNPIDSLPDIFGNMPRLRHLELGTYMGAHSTYERRNLRSLPLSLGSLASLEFLDLSGNNLSVLPDTLRNLHRLKILNLSGNKLDSLPSWIGELTELETIYLSDNQLSTFPESMTKLNRLKYIFAEGNRGLSAAAPHPIGCYLSR